jgi:hypothetical protein
VVRESVAVCCSAKAFLNCCSAVRTPLTCTCHTTCAAYTCHTADHRHLAYSIQRCCIVNCFFELLRCAQEDSVTC